MKCFNLRFSTYQLSNNWILLVHTHIIYTRPFLHFYFPVLSPAVTKWKVCVKFVMSIFWWKIWYHLKKLWLQLEILWQVLIPQIKVLYSKWALLYKHCEIPGELLHKNMLSSQVKRSLLWLHTNWHLLQQKWDDFVFH